MLDVADTSPRPARVLALAALLAAVVAGCGGGEERTGAPAGATPRVTAPGDPEPLKALGEPEGRLDLVAHEPYVQDGTGAGGADWVSDFERETGCRVSVTAVETSAQAVRALRSGRFDGISARSDVALRLVGGGDVAPLNPALVPGYEDAAEALTAVPGATVAGTPYGVPQSRTAHLLMWDKNEIPGSPRSWDAVFDPAQMEAYQGAVTTYDDPMYIADAALLLMDSRPDLGIEDPYLLDDKQFQEAVDLLVQQRDYVGPLWSDPVEEVRAFAAGDAVVGPGRQVAADALTGARDPVPVETVLPREGATGWSVSWMLSSGARHPACMYRWMGHVVDPAVNARIAEWAGEAPAVPEACELTRDPGHCSRHRALDEGFWDEVHLWTTPTRECGDGRGAVCTDHRDWAAAWRDVTRPAD